MLYRRNAALTILLGCLGIPWGHHQPSLTLWMVMITMITIDSYDDSWLNYQYWPWSSWLKFLQIISSISQPSINPPTPSLSVTSLTSPTSPRSWRPKSAQHRYVRQWTSGWCGNGGEDFPNDLGSSDLIKKWLSDWRSSVKKHGQFLIISMESTDCDDPQSIYWIFWYSHHLSTVYSLQTNQPNGVPSLRRRNDSTPPSHALSRSFDRHLELRRFGIWRTCGCV